MHKLYKIRPLRREPSRPAASASFGGGALYISMPAAAYSVSFTYHQPCEAFLGDQRKKTQRRGIQLALNVFFETGAIYQKKASGGRKGPWRNRNVIKLRKAGLHRNVESSFL